MSEEYCFFPKTLTQPHHKSYCSNFAAEPNKKCCSSLEIFKDFKKIIKCNVTMLKEAVDLDKN